MPSTDRSTRLQTELARVIAARERLGVETVRRWIVQAEVDGGIGPGVSSSEHAEIKALKAQVRRHAELELEPV